MGAGSFHVFRCCSIYRIFPLITKVLAKAVATVAKLSTDSQNEIARAMLALADEPEEIDAAHLPAVLEGLAQANAGTFASVVDVEAAFRRFGS